MSHPRLPCPVCKTEQTVEGMLREVVELYKRDNPTKFAHCEIDLEHGVISREPRDPDTIEPLRPRMEMVNDRVDAVVRNLASLETCANCGVLYRPEIRRLAEFASQALAVAQRRCLLDALARKAGDAVAPGS